MSVDLGGFVEIIRPEAVNRTLLDASADVVALRNHSSDWPLGRRSSRSLTLFKDDTGLEIDLWLDDRITFAGDLVQLIRSGTAAGGSFAFELLDDVWSLRNGTPFREVIDMHVREVSLGVTFPAYKTTRLVVEARTQPRRTSVAVAARQLKLARAR